VRPDVYLDCFTPIDLQQITSISSAKQKPFLIDPIPNKLPKDVLPLVHISLLDDQSVITNRLWSSPSNWLQLNIFLKSLLLIQRS
ncbi:hypothetical protein, partial [Candidatus Enterovibrio escicola]|uniref:hypothetical protein n=1 Tax=Candidatus Enterovibrio escicola TaxID=1927127 RepID=UPI001CC260A8